MAGPPKEVPASELFLKLTEPRPSDLIDAPRYDENGIAVGQMRMRVLALSDHDTARIRGHKAVLEKLKREGLNEQSLPGKVIEEVMGDAVAKEVLAMAAMSDVSYGRDERGNPVYARVFRDAKDVEKLTADEVSQLFNGYCEVQYKYGPFEKVAVTKEDVDAWIKRLGEGAAEHPLLRLTLPALAELTSLLAARTYSLSVVLESQWESLPDTLKSSLQKFSLGTGYFGKPALDITETGSESSPEDLADPEPGETISAEEAMRIARERK